ncbi:MAG: NADH-quinone oxidoreductase subunit J, partial [Pseudomonadota bacterium]
MNLLVLPVALPLLAAFVLPVLARVSESFARVLGPLIMAACLGIAAGLADGEPFAVAVGGFKPPFGITFYADGLALLFTGLVAVMTLALWPYRGEFRPREQSLTLILAAAAAGLALSGDLFNIYVFYELVSVASFG